MAEKNTHIETITLEQVPESEKKSWPSIAFIWAGNVICVPALMVGAMVSAGLNFKQSILAMFIGYGIVVGLMMLIAAQSAQTGRPTAIAAVSYTHLDVYKRQTCRRRRGDYDPGNRNRY